MRKHFLAAAKAASLAILVSATPAAACTGTTVLFADDFTIDDPAWGNYPNTTIADGQLTLTVEPATGWTLLNQFSLYQDFDVCIDVSQLVTDSSLEWASLVFWGYDYQNYYAFEVAENGYVRVVRIQNNRQLSPVEWFLTENVVKAGGEVNNLRVQAIGNVARVFLNGQQLVEFRGQPPEGGGLVGVYGYAGSTATATFNFRNMIITTPDGPLEQPGFGAEEGGDVGSGGAPEPGPAEDDESAATLGSKTS